MSRRRLIFATTLVAWPVVAGLFAQSSEPPDKYLWLESVSSERAMTWVKEHNVRTAKVLEGDPLYQPFFRAALAIREDPSHLAPIDLHGDVLYSVWQDEKNQRGLLRQTTLKDYLTMHPHWGATLDYDSLGRQEKVKWTPPLSLGAHEEVMSCQYPGNSLCMLGLSDGGEDAITLREFNLKTGTFVTNGFQSNHSKQDVDWEDENTLLISRDWGEGSMSKSGYPFVVKRWKRGTALSEAKEIFRGQPSDLSAEGGVLRDAEGNHLVLFQRYISYFDLRNYFQDKSGHMQQIALPKNCTIYGLQKGYLIFLVHEDWQGVRQGSVAEVSLQELLADPSHLRPTVIFAPTADEFANDLQITRNHLVLTTLKNVQGRAYVYTRDTHGWRHTELTVPENATITSWTATPLNDSFFLSVTSFLLPSSYWYCDAAKHTCRMAQSQSAQFDATAEVVEQFFATSKDGTRVPYFVVHRKDMKLDGSTPTLMEAYGGFEDSMTPYYNGILGKLWLERGGAYVVPNIRGGGEFGPAWHEVARKIHRQRTYDDFAAVALDLFARKITSAQRLGIRGASNGGLLMGVAMTQHPDYYKAVIPQVPLLDMLRFEQIAAGASWTDEFGSVSVPEERAFLASTSPYAQLRPDVTYPEPLILTTTNDDRVGPQHARKFAAKLEEYHKPFFYDEIIEGGHNSGADLREQARTSAIQFVYLTRKLMQ
jgi:prolyl oligopeptidase